MITLNEGQQECKTKILGAISNAVDFYTLKGAAGVGKTTLVAHIINNIPMGKTVCVATPTHKATKVARKMGIERGISHRVDYNTIHAVLGIKPVRKGGEEVYAKDKYAEEKVYDVLIIDEASMLGDDIIQYILECESVTIIFIGDSYQISPVNNSGRISLAFTEVADVSSLTKIVRYDNPIINLATSIRDSQDNKTDMEVIETDLDDNGEGVMVLGFKMWFDRLIKEFKSDKFKRSKDHCRVVAYTNSSVDKLNDKIRKVIHGDDVEEYIIGDVVVAQRGHKRNEFKNADELEIVGITELYDSEYGYDYWELHVRSLEDSNMFRLNVLKSTSETKFQAKLNELKSEAYVNFETSSECWAKFWVLMDKYFPVKHIYCCTGHKSQGSTFNNTFLFLKDFQGMPHLMVDDAIQLKQLVYTVVTRSSKLTIVNQ
jgi:hypothetical protein